MIIYLHSSKVRYKEGAMLKKYDLHIDLHSSKVRYKALQAFNISSFEYIYIPPRLDIKSLNISKASILKSNLHSSKVRYKAFKILI